MAAELTVIERRHDRWRFALGCARATLLTLPPRGEPGRALLAAILAGIGAAGSLVAVAFVRYPDIHRGAGAWLAFVAFLGVLATFGAVAVAAVAASAVRPGTSGAGFGPGLVVAASWFALGSAASIHRPWLWLPAMIAVPVATLSVGALAGWRRADAAIGRMTVVVAGVIAALGLFVALAAETVATGGRPYDAGQINDFRQSHFHDLATYAVNDNLGSAMVLLLLIPMVTLALGFAGVALGTRLRRRAVAGS